MLRCWNQCDKLDVIICVYLLPITQRRTYDIEHNYRWRAYTFRVQGSGVIVGQ